MEAPKKEMDVFAYHKETVKPSSPTPSHNQTFKLSIFDQFAPPIYMPGLFFYGASSDGGHSRFKENSLTTVGQRLKKSLSEILTRFYPLAGRLSVNTPVINCNDEGVHYVEARANFPMAKVLQRPQVEELNHHFIPTFPANLGFDSVPLLLVQTTFFECGGVVIGISVSHKIADGASIHTFMQAWARVTSGNPQAVVVPDFSCPPQFPSLHPLPVKSFNSDLNPEGYISRRFVLDASKVRRLKDIAASDAVPYPSKTEVVSALLWKCFTKASAARTSTSGPKKNSSFLTSIVNIRPNLTPPLPYYAMGNVVAQLLLKQDKSTEMMKEGMSRGFLRGLVRQLREERKEFVQNLSVKLQGGGQEIMISTLISLWDDYSKQQAGAIRNADYWYALSSICGMDFYGIDFGLGKPIWFSIPLTGLPNSTFLIDSSDGEGVEALVSLVEEEIILLEHDPEFLEFVSVNPSPLKNSKETSHTSWPSAL